MADAKYQLMCELRGHGEDVRAVCSCPLGIVTASRDKTLKLWAEGGGEGGGPGFAEAKTFAGHRDFVSCCLFVPGDGPSQWPQDVLVSGSRDATVIVWDLATCQPLQTLRGHKYQVTDLALQPSGELASTSLDGTIKLWRDGACARTLEGHEGPVQCVVALPTGQLVTGSNDKTIRVWADDGACVHTIRGHTDTVRGLCLVPGVGVASASHDQTLRLWDLQGQLLAEVVGHHPQPGQQQSALVYRVAASDELLASASEDCTARLWRLDGAPLQALDHPGCVWDIAFLASGDVVTACADHVARVWTRDPQRAAPAAAQEAYQANIEALKASAKEEAAQAGQQGGGTPGGLPPGLKLEDKAALLAPGARDGEYKFVREGGANIAYAWDAANCKWEKLGDILGGTGAGGGGDTVSTGTKMFRGKEYDYVCDVAMEDNAPSLKLAFNRDDNPWLVAERDAKHPDTPLDSLKDVDGLLGGGSFLQEHGLDPSLKQQVVDFIHQNGGGAAPAGPPPTQNFDPFTGGGAYVPATSFPAATSRHSAPYATASGHSVTGGGVDPFTGSAASRPAGSGPPGGPPLLPQRTLHTFPAVPKANAISGKLRELGSGLPAPQGLTAPQGALLDGLVAKAEAAAQGRGGAALSGEEAALLRALLAWPPAALFPALDLARLLALDPGAAAALGPPGQGLGLLGPAFASAAAPPQLSANQLTALRLACNMAARNAPWALAGQAQLMEWFQEAASASSRPVRTAWASLLANLAQLVVERAGGAPGGPPGGSAEGEDEEARLTLLSAACGLLEGLEPADTDPAYRGLLAAGTLAKGSAAVAETARGLGLLETAQKLASGNPALAALGREVVAALQA